MGLALAIIVAIVTVLFALLQVFAAGMSDVPGATSGAGWTLGIGLPIAAILAVTHWYPIHLSW
jgi:hypothetical protein